jgi:uncharacterized protein YbjT (DUF2867 family)
MKKAVVLGGSGLVGSFLMKELLASEEIEKVHSFARRSLNLDNPKLEEHLGDLLTDSFWEIKQKADLLFICIGTTQKKTPDRDLYRSIDYGIPKQAAEWAKEQGFKRVLVISSLGADAGASNFYLRTKGRMEEAVLASGLESVILRPSMILGPREEQRFLESLGKGLFKIFKPFIPKRYRGVEAEDIAKAMFRLSLADKAPEIIYSEDIPEIAAD